MDGPETASRPHALRTRAFGTLMVAGGALAGITVALPPAAANSEAVVVVAGAIALAVGVALLLARRDPGELALGAVAALGTVLITVATYEGGFDGTGTADNQMLYVWVCLFGFYFLGLGNAIAQLGVVGAAYAWLLSQQHIAAGDAATRWIVTMTALLIAGVLVARLRRSNDGLVSELRGRARIDPLTGVLNRDALAERAEVEFARARRGSGAVAILVTDIDDFKTINDSLGHPAGDQVLRKVTAVLTAETRNVDAVARVGGDEFAILLPGVTAMAARMIAERLRVEVRRAAGDMHLRLSLSIGIAIGPPDGATLDDLWKAADRAMYEAKRSGGDAVASAAELASDKWRTTKSSPTASVPS
jgi:diguanylate cyclase (GGDEF)-like protein